MLAVCAKEVSNVHVNCGISAGCTAVHVQTVAVKNLEV